MRQFPLSPLTIVVGDQTRVAMSAELYDETRPHIWHVAFSDEEGIDLTVGEDVSDAGEEVRFRLPNGLLVVIRHVVESDSEAARNHPFFPNHPLPVDVIGAIMNGTQGPPTLYAVVDDGGGVNTLALVANNGAYVRYGRAWRQASPRTLIGRTLIPIDDLEVEAYDQADENGRQLTREMISTVPQSARPVMQASPMTDPVVTASAPIIAPIVSSLEDAETALGFAQEHPETRWYVEKRLKALGWQEPFPWAGE